MERHGLNRSGLGRGMAIGVLAAMVALVVGASHAEDRAKEAYIRAVVRGAGLMAWQKPGVSEGEAAFRAEAEARKDAMLAGRAPVRHPVMIGEAELEQARKNIASAPWAENWFDAHKRKADYLVAQPEGYVDAMIEALTPANTYGATCANCVGKRSQEAVGVSLFTWDHEHPDVIRCAECGQVYPDERFPEEATLECPRTGQSLTFYRNEAEKAHPDDRTGRYAWHWVGHPVHTSYAGIIRAKKASFMMSGARSLGLAYAMTGEIRYAAMAKRILVRLAQCYRHWMYHDYWDTYADCDPLYAAWHDRALPIEWKRHLCEEVYAKDSLDAAAMLQNYWGAGRLSPSTDSISGLHALCQAYDLVGDAKNEEGQALWPPEERALVERDLFLEWVMGAEPYIGGAGAAECVNNKAPRIYRAMAAAGVCLGLPDYADVALRGYEALRDQSFLYDGFSKESPSYTNMYLSSLIWVPETLHGFTWPEGYGKRSGTLDIYGSDDKLRLMYRSVIDQLAPDGTYLPLSDTRVNGRPSTDIIEIGMKRYPEYFAGTHPAQRGEGSPSEYATLYLDAGDFEAPARDDLPEIVYPAWMTAILRHGRGTDASALAMVYNPPGGHRHYDNLSLYYVDQGDVVLGDLGYVGDMPVNRWIKSTLSHNLVIVDGEDQHHGGDAARQPRLHMAATSPVLSVVEASSTAYSQCREYRRLVVLIKGPEGRTFAVDIFRVQGGKKHAYQVFSDVASSDAGAEGTLAFEGLDMPPEPPLPDVGQSLASADIFGLRDGRQADAPPAWCAVWREPTRRYRLWMRSPADAVLAANGPGQTMRTNAGRRVRYVNAIRTGEDLASTFVAVHEPAQGSEDWAVSAVNRLDVPSEAGAGAVALQIESAWGTYTILNAFAEACEAAGTRFQGRLAVTCSGPSQEEWSFTLGASTLKQGERGFEGQAPVWQGVVKSVAGDRVTLSEPMPEGWPMAPEGTSNYLMAHDGTYWTGFQIVECAGAAIEVSRFIPPPLGDFVIHALRFDRF